MVQSFSGYETLVDAFEAQAAAAPHAVALRFGDDAVTYRSLQSQSHAIARSLVARGASSSSYVGVHLPRGPLLIAAILGILKAGAAYVPLDFGLPRERVRFIAEDARLRLVVSPKGSSVEAIGCASPEELLDEGNASPSPAESHLVRRQHAAYVIYTSGSSGSPKGVVCTHWNVVRLLQATQAQYGFRNSDVWTLFHSVGFDFSVWEIFGALLFGGTLIIVTDEQARDPSRFWKLLRHERVTVLNQTPSSFNNLCQFSLAGNLAPPASLRWVIFGGERLITSSLREWCKRYGDERPRLVNMYGITETTVHVTYREIRAADLDSELSPIGEPISDLNVYLLDESLQPVEDGCEGEICVGGAGVSAGYLDRPDLTAARFLQNPFGSEDAPLLYRSGDLGLRLPGKGLFYVGRRDRQVKIRGHRVELQEIEHAACGHSSVRAAHAMAIEFKDRDRRLACFVVPDRDTCPAVYAAAELRRRNDLKLLRLRNGIEVAHVNRAEVQFMYREIFESPSNDWHVDALPANPCVVDVGANIGLFSIYVASRCRSARIVAIEAIPATAALLAANLGAYCPQAKVIQTGIADRDGSALFRYYPRTSVLSGRHPGADDHAAMRAYLDNAYSGQVDVGEDALDSMVESRLVYEDVDVRLETLSAVIEREGLEQIDLLKVDVERSELEVLAGIGEEHWPSIGQILMEVHDRDGRLTDTCALLQARGFAVAVERDPLLKGAQLCNVHATRPSVGAANARIGRSVSTVLTPVSLREALRQELSTKLPAYMVPSHLHLLAEMPLTRNGKVDEPVLQAIAFDGAEGRGQARGGLNAVEESVRGIWLELLGVNDVEPDVTLADAGGHSLLAVRLALKLRDAFNVNIPLRHLNEDSTVSGIAKLIVQGRTEPSGAG